MFRHQQRHSLGEKRKLLSLIRECDAFYHTFPMYCICALIVSTWNIVTNSGMCRRYIHLYSISSSPPIQTKLCTPPYPLLPQIWSLSVHSELLISVEIMQAIPLWHKLSIHLQSVCQNQTLFMSIWPVFAPITTYIYSDNITLILSQKPSEYFLELLFGNER